MDRGAWQAIVHGVAKAHTRLSNEHTCVRVHTHTHTHTHTQSLLILTCSRILNVPGLLSNILLSRHQISLV